MSGTPHLEDNLRLLPGPPRPAPRVETVTVVDNTDLGASQYRLLLASEWISEHALAGEFVMITVPSSEESRILLPRPMAIHRRHPGDGVFEVIFKIVGRGTRALSTVRAGVGLTVTGPLGNAFLAPPATRSILLIGRGIGICSLMGVAEDVKGSGVAVTLLASSRSAETAVGLDDAAELGVTTIAVNDADGTSERESVQRLLRERLDAAPPSVIMVCGSSRLTSMATDLAAAWGADLQVSLEANMACGVGYCHGCAAPMRSRPDREGPLVCVDGPVFRIEV